MDTISSGEFRKTYHRLKGPTAVTANGRVIGTWTPILYRLESTEPPVTLAAITATKNAIQNNFATVSTMSQAERDAILRRANKG